ncbi:SusC/RagA family TonB-linked outer membrane protein [Bacteroides neonati]|uniref:SusC/RagA family TonB-linked outer membrane protein n=1 Tax=Bacteroides neonati TaxID=1347393 RepID=UPI0004B8AF8C|nr:SusC/RagA family TonB-linked outer membrane protein [Bacteroides neonati]
MKKRFKLFLTCLIIGVGLVTAQTSKVTGVVISAEDGEPVVGASILVSGTTLGTVTDIDGKFTIINVPETAKTLRISYVGMVSQDVAIQKGIMKITLQSDAKALDEIVVTAMGMKRSEKTLGYSASTVKSDRLDVAKSGSVMSGLTGKVAGVQISTAGNTGTSQKVLVRGIASLNSNSPLYIVDGVPLDNGRIGNNAADFGNGANDINSDDVESVTVLKGASATALYGSRAANGVIMVTTKKAGIEKLSISYDGTFSASNVLRVMQTQDRFGQGWGSWDRAENGSWGPALDGTMHEWGSNKLKDPMVKPFSYVEHNLRDFYQTGFETNNNITLRYGNENVGVVGSYGNLSSSGILPLDGDKYARNTFSVRGYVNTKRLTMDMSLNYVRKDIRRTEGMDMELLQHAVDVSFVEQKDYNDVRYNTNNYYTWYAQNPYWMIDNYKYNYQDDRIFGKYELSYELIKGLKATGRLGGDFTNYRIENSNPILKYANGSYSKSGGKSEEIGHYSEFRYDRSQIDATAFLSADYQVGDFSLNGTAGWNLNQRTYGYTGGTVDGLEIEGWYNLLNTSSAAVADSYTSKRRLIAAFAQVEVGYKEFLFLNLSGRNDWSSTLPMGDNSFLYGGANASVILSELFPKLKENKVDFLKIRAAIGQTGNDADVYKTSDWYRMANFAGTASSYNYYTSLPFGGVLGMTSNNTVGSKTLKPEITTEYEFGVSGNFFGNRLTVDFAYYNKQTKNQIISATLAPETSYVFETRNVGKIENKGVELMVNVVPLRTTDWEWTLGATFSKNKSKVKELWDGLDEYTFTTWRGVDYVLKVGGPVAQYRIPMANRVTDEKSPFFGYTIVNNNGFQSDSQTEKEYVGSSQPDFVMGFNTVLKYKNFTFSATADWRKGGYILSNTSYITHFNGNSTQTVFNERNAFIYPHSVKVVGGKYVENNIPIYNSNMNYAQGNYSYSPQARREFILPKDYFKLREVSLSYTFPKKLLDKTPIKQLVVSVVGRNLLLFTPKENNYIDPEASNLGNDLLSEFGETTGTSTTRNFGGSLKVVF